MRATLGALLLLAAAAASASVTVTYEGSTKTYNLRVGTTIVSRHGSLAEALSAAELRGDGGYTITQPTATVQVASEPPPPPPPPAPPPTASRYLSPSGDDSGECTEAAPCKTFTRGFTGLPAGGEVVLLDGSYPQSISYVGTGSAQPPSGLSLEQPTVVRAKNHGSVTVAGLFIGRSTRKDKFIRIEGITFIGGGKLYNADFVTVKSCGFHGPFSVGTNEHTQGNSFNLIEDVWVWARFQRIIAINYRAHFNVWRRVLVRGDGCGTTACSGSGNPNVGITVYDSHDISLQNVLVVDRILAPTDAPYADFAAAQHTSTPVDYHFGRNEWLGTVSIKAPDQGYYMEPDNTIDQTVRISHAVAWGAKSGAFNIARKGTNNVLEFLTANVLGGDGIRIAPEMTTGTLKGVVVTGSGRYGINSRYKPENATVFGSWTNSAYNATYSQQGCSVGCSLANPNITNPLRSGDPTRGATVEFRYGLDGSRHGDQGFRDLTATPLLPWPNEARIKAEMCATVTRGFCSASSLSSYIQAP